MKVSNLTNRQGNKVANQFIIEDGNKVAFQSYNSKIVEVEGTWITFFQDYNYSATTSKYRNKFLSDVLECNITSKDVEKMIKDKSFSNFNVILIGE